MSAPVIDVDQQLLRAWPLPQPDPEGDKDTRGRAAIVAGSSQIAGAAWLAGVASLRSGAGKLVVATAERVAVPLALRLPEARVVPMPETRDGSLGLAHLDEVTEVVGQSDALLIGPGLQGEAGSAALVRAMVDRLADNPERPLILDAIAMGAVDSTYPGPMLVTPHAGEMAHLTGMSKEAISTNMETAARTAALRWNVVVALKGPTTYIATPDGQVWRHRSGNAGLATSGSGDVLAGIILGIAARGATLVQAAVWGVAVHALAGEALATRIGPIGYLASELPGELPGILKRFDAR